jgi:hypothetical protein
MMSRLERGEHSEDIATVRGVSIRTAYKWRRRYRAEGVASLRDRSSRPRASPNKTPDDVEAAVIALRRQRRIHHRIAAETGVSRTSVGRILVRHGPNRWRDLEPAAPARRYERARPGEMIHLDIKKLGRFNTVGPRKRPGLGWEFVHVCIGDYSKIGRATAPGRSRKPAPHWARATSSPNPTRQRPTERPSVSSNRPCANGLMPGRIETPSRGPGNCRAGCAITIGIARMPG